MQTLAIILLNYLFILVAITLFVCPFYIVFKKYRQKSDKSRSVNQELEDFFQSKQANWLVFFWAFGEALVWFVIPEFLLLLMIFMRINRKRELLFFDIYGTTVGALVAYAINLPTHLIDKLPYIQPKMVAQTQVWYQQHSILGLIYQPFSGVPYKVFTFLAPHYHFFILAFIIVAVVVRIARYYIFFAMFSLIYPVLHKYVYRNYLRLVLIAILIFSILLLRVYQSYGHYRVTSGSVEIVQTAKQNQTN
jgi:membrane protein YqaA with SNARE-associated domain